MYSNNKLNDNRLLKDNDNIKFTFVPQVYKSDEYTYHYIESSVDNQTVFLNFMQTREWKSFLKYCFKHIRPYYLPFYTPEMYYLDQINSSIKDKNGVISMVITGTITKYDSDYVKEHYNKNCALNKTWSDTIDKTLQFKHFYDLVKDSFYKATNEGEMEIPDIGDLCMGNNTKMKLKIIN